jgi:hypothetical protein
VNAEERDELVGAVLLAATLITLVIVVVILCQ